MIKALSFISIIGILITSCIGDDFINDAVEPVVRINSKIDTLAIGDTYQFSASYFNNIGVEEIVPFQWTSSNSEVLIIDDNGLATGLIAGNTEISAIFEDGQMTFRDRQNIAVGEETVESTGSKFGTVVSSGSYELSGDFEIFEANDVLKIEFAENYKASTALPGLYIYLSNNRNSIANAFEIGAVKIFEGSHSYEIRNIGLDDYSFILFYCKPFNVKVGDGEIK